jgi:platelet-activating factor acetylhydrolase IB subunit alpha
MLEKKWTAVIRLQKKVLELEAKLGSQGNGEGPGRSNGPREDSKLLPKGPPRATMSGHRGAITSVASHPVYRSLHPTPSSTCLPPSHSSNLSLV